MGWKIFHALVFRILVREANIVEKGIALPVLWVDG